MPTVVIARLSISIAAKLDKAHVDTNEIFWDDISDQAKEKRGYNFIEIYL